MQERCIYHRTFSGGKRIDYIRFDTREQLEDWYADRRALYRLEWWCENVLHWSDEQWYKENVYLLRCQTVYAKFKEFNRKWGDNATYNDITMCLRYHVKLSINMNEFPFADRVIIARGDHDVWVVLGLDGQFFSSVRRAGYVPLITEDESYDTSGPGLRPAQNVYSFEIHSAQCRLRSETEQEPGVPNFSLGQIVEIVDFSYSGPRDNMKGYVTRATTNPDRVDITTFTRRKTWKSRKNLSLYGDSIRYRDW